MSSVLITGVAGGLGSRLAGSLLSAGRTVVGVDDLSAGKKENVALLCQRYHRFSFIQDDVCSGSLSKELEKLNISEIYHLASLASPYFYQKYPLKTIAANTIGLQNMLELAVKLHAKLLFTSTSEVYGDPEVHPQHEMYRGNVNTWGPRACYDESKRLGEVLCYEYWKSNGIPIKIARLFNTYSPDMRSDDGRVVSNFVMQAVLGTDITIYGDGSQTRSFCYVDDTIRALVLMMSRDEANGEIINIGNPDEYTIKELADIIIDLTGASSRIIYRPLPKDDPCQRRPAIEKAERLLGWRPQISLEEGLLRMVEKFKENLKL